MYKTLLKRILHYSPLVFCSFFHYQCIRLAQPTTPATFRISPSKYPCQIRCSMIYLGPQIGFAVGMYDGHGGWQAQLCKNKLLDKLKEKINTMAMRVDDSFIVACIKESFLDIDAEYKEKVKGAYEMGFGKTARVGSSALVCTLYRDRLFTANIGDSLAIIITKGHQFHQLNKEHHANNQEEQKRLRMKFPQEEDVIVCVNKQCSVKGRLHPTRAIGDLRLKSPEYNNPMKYRKEFDFQAPIEVFSGPYISANPEISVVRLTSQHKCVVMASDGFWKKITKAEVAQTTKNVSNKQLTKHLLELYLQKVAKDNNITLQQLKAIPQGKKRTNIMDDVSVAVLDLVREE